MSNKPPVDLSAMNRAFFEALDPTARVELLCRLHTMTVELSERLARNSANSSRPPSSDSPFGGAPTAAGSGGSDLRNALKGSAAGGVGATPGTPRKPGKQRGAKGIWRCEALTAERAENHYPDRCAACGAPLELWHGDKGHSGHFVFDLERLPGGVRIACVLHRYHEIRCPCGTDSLTPILARVKRACRLNEDAAAAKARALAREILNDWEVITAFVTNPNLPPTNNDAETALRHAVIARRISFGTRTDERVASLCRHSQRRRNMPATKTRPVGAHHRSRRKRPKGRPDFHAACSHAANLTRVR